MDRPIPAPRTGGVERAGSGERRAREESLPVAAGLPAARLRIRSSPTPAARRLLRQRLLFATTFVCLASATALAILLVSIPFLLTLRARPALIEARIVPEEGRAGWSGLGGLGGGRAFRIALHLAAESYVTVVEASGRPGERARVRVLVPEPGEEGPRLDQPIEAHTTVVVPPDGRAPFTTEARKRQSVVCVVPHAFPLEPQDVADLLARLSSRLAQAREDDLASRLEEALEETLGPPTTLRLPIP